MIYGELNKVIADIDARSLRRARVRAQATPDVAARLATFRNSWWLGPGTALAMSKAGVDAESEVARAASKAQAKKKSKSGIGWHSIGDAVGAVGSGVKAVGNAVQSVAKPVVRGAFMAGDAAIMEPIGVIGNIAAMGEKVGPTLAGAAGGAATGAAVGAMGFNPFSVAGGALAGAAAGGVAGYIAADDVEGKADWSSRSHLGIALDNLVRGKDVDVGSGWFPGGEVEEKENRRARAVTVGGQGFDPGRLIAASVSEPGSMEHKVLSGLVNIPVWIKDPAGLTLKAAGHANRSRSLLVAGGVDGTRKGTLPEVINGWKQGDGAQVADWLAGEKSFQKIWEATDKKLPVKAITELQDADNVDDVWRILDPLLGTAVREKPKVGGLGYEVRSRAFQSRLWQKMPGDDVPVDDIDRAVEVLDRFQRNNNLDPLVRAANNEKLARSNGRAEMFDAVMGVMGDTKGVLVQNGISPHVAKRMTTAFSETIEEFRKYAIDELGENMRVPGAIIGADGKALPTPHYFIEHLNNSIPLPDIRALRGATGKFPHLFGPEPTNLGKGWQIGAAGTDWFIGQAWKPWQLLRGAWTARVIGEEQFRIAGAGLESVVSHPLGAMLWAAHKRGGNDALGRGFKEASEAAADADEYAKALYSTAKESGWWDNATQGGIATKNRYNLKRAEADPDQFVRAWADEFSLARRDPVALRVAGGWSDGDRVPGGLSGNHVEDAKRWLWEGPGKKFRLEMADDGTRAVLRTKAGSDAHIETVAQRIQQATGGDTDLLSAIATGRLGDAPIREGAGPSKRLIESLKVSYDSGLGPQVVVGDQIVAGAARKNVAGHYYNRALQAGFSVLMGKPSNWLSRSPAFRQFYWQRMEEVFPLMDEAGQTRALANARKAKLGNETLARMEKAAGTPGELTINEADFLAKSFGLDSTRDLLYDLSDRSQFFDITRNIFPFGEAWAEVITRWAKIGVEHPEAGRRFQQGMQGARSQGFFHENDQGEEVFSFPGTKWLSDNLIGVPIPLTGRVQGLSLMTEVLPGVGPAVQWPAAYLFSKLPESSAEHYQWLQDFLLPFGPPDTSGGLLEAFFPAYLKRLKGSGKVPFLEPSPEQARILGNTASSIMDYLVTSGEVDRPRTEEELADLADTAMEKAEWFMFMRGVVQFGAPSAPAPEFLAADKDGNLLVAQVMIKDYYEMIKKDGYDGALFRFLDKYGDAAYILTQAKTRSVSYNAPVTKEGLDWVRKNPGVERAFPNVYGFFAPTGSDIDFDAYNRLLASGKKIPLTPAERMKLANNKIASAIYYEAREAAGEKPSDEQRAWLRNLKEELQDEFLGYGDVGVVPIANVQTAIKELSDAVDDRRLRDTPLAEATRIYLDRRAQALAVAEKEASGLSSLLNSKKFAAHRQWLRDVGFALIADYPEFSTAFEQLFDRELKDDDPEVTP